MADSTAGETETGVVTKIRLTKTSEKKKEKVMIRYYSTPEKQQKLKERIQEYEEQSRNYQLKAKELKQYLWVENETQ
jgi:hypothetical protein